MAIKKGDRVTYDTTGRGFTRTLSGKVIGKIPAHTAPKLAKKYNDQFPYGTTRVSTVDRVAVLIDTVNDEEVTPFLKVPKTAWIENQAEAA